MKLVILGAPGAGKGTQARNLAAYYKIAHIASSDLLRQHLENADSEAASAIKNTMDKGGLVSDDIMISLLKNRINRDDCKNGFILDGFPRTLTQAGELAIIVPKLDYAISVYVEDQLILERISGRVVCSNCGVMFHTFYYPPKQDKVCDNCGNTLTQREDDKTHTVLNRLKTYHDMTEPIIEYYRNSGILIEVDGVGETSEITDLILSKLAMGEM